MKDRNISAEERREVILRALRLGRREEAFQTADTGNTVEPENDRRLGLARRQGWERCEEDVMVLPGQGRGSPYRGYVGATSISQQRVMQALPPRSTALEGVEAVRPLSSWLQPSWRCWAPGEGAGC